MAAIPVRNLSEETHRALTARAARSGRSIEAEVLAILDAAVESGDRVRLGSQLADVRRSVGAVELLEPDDPPHEPTALT